MHSSDVGLIVLVVVDDAAVVASSAEWKLHCHIDSQYHTVSFSFFCFLKSFTFILLTACPNDADF